MKNLKLLATALVAAAISLPALADISIKGDGRYRIGNTADANSTQYRNYRMRTTISGGNSNAGISVRLDATDDSSGNPTGLAAADLNAFFKVGMIRVDAGDLGTGFGGTGVKMFEGTGGNGDFKVSLATDSFNAFVRSSQSVTAGNKSDTLSFGAGGSIQGINIQYVNQSNQAGGKGSLFSDIYVSGDFAGASFAIESVDAKATDSDTLLTRLTVPVGAYTVKLGYAKFDANANNEDGASIIGESALSGAYATTSAGSVGSTENTFTGLGVAGSAGSINYQLTGGSIDDDVPATSNSFYDINLSYSLDSSTTLNFGFGRVQGNDGMGFEASYSF